MSRFLVLAGLAAAELLTLAALLINLATVHDPLITRILGPVHGVAYLAVALIALLAPGVRWWVRLLGLVPVIGGVLAAWWARPRR